MQRGTVPMFTPPKSPALLPSNSEADKRAPMI